MVSKDEAVLAHLHVVLLAPVDVILSMFDTILLHHRLLALLSGAPTILLARTGVGPHVSNFLFQPPNNILIVRKVILEIHSIICINRK